MIVLLAMTATIACSDNKKDQEMAQMKIELEALKSENTKLKAGEKKLKTSVDQYNKFLKEIEQNLAEINKSKDLVTKLNQEAKGGKKDVSSEIKNHIANIKALMENSRLKVMTLDKSMNALRKESAGKSDEILALDRQVKSLTKNLLDKDAEIELLDNELDQMEELYQMEAKYAAELKAILNRAYYINASGKQLKSLGVVTNEGGFIGIGRVKMIRANTQDSLFIQIRKDEHLEFEMTGKNSQLISQHPDGSYEWTLAGDKRGKLTIKDPETFWKSGNYLVIQSEK